MNSDRRDAKELGIASGQTLNSPTGDLTKECAFWRLDWSITVHHIFTNRGLFKRRVINKAIQ